MRNVERQAKALKLAMETASDIQANPTWDYAHIVASIQAAILEVDEAPKTAGITDAQMVSNEYSMEFKPSVEGFMVTLSTPIGAWSYVVEGSAYALQALRDQLKCSKSASHTYVVFPHLKDFTSSSIPNGIELRLVRGQIRYKASIKFNNVIKAKEVAEDFFLHIFSNTPTIGIAQ